MGSAANERFIASTNIDYDRWKEGEGYDLEALHALDPDEAFRSEHWLLARAGHDWRDLEGLLAIGSPAAKAAVIDQLRNGKLEQRLHAARLVEDDPKLGTDNAAEVEAAAIAGLESALLFYGLSIALDLATTLRTPALIHGPVPAHPSRRGRSCRPRGRPPGIHPWQGAGTVSTGSSARCSSASTRRIARARGRLSRAVHAMRRKSGGVPAGLMAEPPRTARDFWRTDTATWAM